MIKKRSPRAWRPRGHNETDTTLGSVADSFPRCKLHGSRIVYRFPEGCPCATDNPLDRISAIERRGWAQLGDRCTNDNRGGLTLLTLADTCLQCVGPLLRHRHARYLRERGPRCD